MKTWPKIGLLCLRMCLWGMLVVLAVSMKNSFLRQYDQVPRHDTSKTQLAVENIEQEAGDAPPEAKQGLEPAIAEPHDEVWYLNGVKKGEIKSLEAIPKKMRTTEVCLAALKQDIEINDAIIPDKSWTKEVAIAFAEKDPHRLSLIPERLMTAEVAKAGIGKWGGALRLIPFEMVTPELVKFALESDLVEAFAAIPDSFKTPELCLRVIREKPETLRYVPWELRTLELCHLALAHSNDAWDWVPKKYAILPLQK